MIDYAVKTEYTDILSTSPIFRELNEESITDLLNKSGSVIAYGTGELITDIGKNALSLILEGSLDVFNYASGTKLNHLRVGDFFGFTTLFQQQKNSGTIIKATEESIIFHLDENKLEELFKKDFGIAMNYIRYLTSKIFFLNSKINSFVKYGAKERLKEYFCKEIKKQEEDIIRLNCSVKELSNLLNVGRASLYRAFDELEAEGAIKKEAKVIKIINKKYFL